MLTADNIELIALFTAISIAANTTLWGVAQKYRLLERYETYSRLWMPGVCVICISFWAALIYTTPIALMIHQPLLFICPFLAAGPTVRFAFK